MKHILIIIIALICMPAQAYTEKGLYCLAMNIYHEARGESEEGQLAVAAVTLNRVASRRFPNTICDVVWQRRQFSWTHLITNPEPRDVEAWNRAQQLARIAVRWHQQGEDLSYGALYYHADYVSPYWARSFEVTTAIGRHIFYSN